MEPFLLEGTELGFGLCWRGRRDGARLVVLLPPQSFSHLTAFARGSEVHIASCPCSISFTLACLALKESGWHSLGSGGSPAGTVHPIPALPDQAQHVPGPQLPSSFCRSSQSRAPRGVTCPRPCASSPCTLLMVALHQKSLFGNATSAAEIKAPRMCGLLQASHRHLAPGINAYKLIWFSFNFCFIYEVLYNKVVLLQNIITDNLLLLQSVNKAVPTNISFHSSHNSVKL